MQIARICKTSIILLLAIIFLVNMIGCGKERQPIMSVPTRDVRTIISAFQEQILKPAGVPLTEAQENRIKEEFNPAAPNDMRPVLGAFTKEQKEIFVNSFRKYLRWTLHPLTKSQTERIMSIGPGSKELSWAEILDEKQLQIMMEKRMREMQKKRM